MREIIFRGQTRRNGEKVWMDGRKVPSSWVYGGVLQGTGSFSIIYGCDDVDDKHASNLEKHVVYTDTLGQYTGLTDKNGTKIFEGDIVKAKQGKTEEIATIRFENGVFMVCPVFGKIYERNIWEYWYNDWDLEIIGNIHDTPELLDKH